MKPPTQAACLKSRSSRAGPASSLPLTGYFANESKAGKVPALLFKPALTRKFHKLFGERTRPRVPLAAPRRNLAPSAFNTLSDKRTPSPSARRRREHARARVLPMKCEISGLSLMPFGNSPMTVPKGQLRVAQRFNAGRLTAWKQVPKGRLNGHPAARSLSRPFGTPTRPASFPALKRRAFVVMSLRDKRSSNFRAAFPSIRFLSSNAFDAPTLER